MSVMHADGVVTSLKQHVHTRTDVDECATNKHNCDANAVCTDTKDGFTCACKTGFSGNGTKCTATAGGMHSIVRMT